MKTKGRIGWRGANIVGIMVALSLLLGLVVGCGSQAGQPSQPTSTSNVGEKATSPGGETQSEGTKTLTFGGVFELTGSGAGLGIPYSDGIKVAVAEINEQGGIKVGNERYKVDLKLFDSRGVVADAVGLAEKLVTEEKVPVLYGPAFSSSLEPMQEITQKAKVIHLATPTATEKHLGKPGKDFLFKMSMPSGGDRGMAALFVPAAIERTGIKTVAIIMPNDDAGTSYVKTYGGQFESHGVKILTTERYEHGTKDFYPTLTKIKTMNPDGIFFGFSDEDAQPLVRQVKELGINSVLIGSPGISADPGMTAAKEPLENYAWYSQKNLASKDPKVMKFVESYKRILGKELASSTDYAVPQYAWTMYLAGTIEKVGSLDWEKINKSLRSNKYQGGLLDLEVDDVGQGRYSFEIGQIKNGGPEFSIVKLPPAKK